MRRFTDPYRAIEYAELGGQSLCITGWYTAGTSYDDTSGDLFDEDRDRLADTAHDLRSKSRVREWQPGRGVFFLKLTGKAMKRALGQCFTRILRKTVAPWENAK